MNNPICWEKSSRVIHISSTSPNLFYFQSITVNLISEPTFIFPNNFLYFLPFFTKYFRFLQKKGELAFALCSPLCRLMSIWQTRHHICLRLALSACCLFSGYCFNRCSMAFMTCVISFVRSTCRLSCISTNPRTFSPLPDNANRCAYPIHIFHAANIRMGTKNGDGINRDIMQPEPRTQRPQCIPQRLDILRIL